MIAIVVLNWNGCSDTLQCLRSLSQLTEKNFFTVVVDNGSTDDSVSQIRAQFPEVTLLQAGKNLGFAGGNNVGIAYALEQGAQFVLLLNNDTIVDANLLEHFLEGFEKKPDAGILGAKIYLQDRANTLDHLGGLWNRKSGQFELVGWRELDDGRWDEMLKLDYVCGACLMIKREVLEKIGQLEPRFFLFWEEADFCTRASRAGYVSYYCPKAIIWHKGSASFSGGKVHASYFHWRSRLLWIERNCSPRERWNLAWPLLKEVGLLWRRKKFKGLQISLGSPFLSADKLTAKKLMHARYTAALAGVRDYRTRKFTSGPAWIYKAPSK